MRKSYAKGLRGPLRSIQPPLLYILPVSFFAGIFLMALLRRQLLFQTGFLDQETLYQMKYMTVDNHLFFLYVTVKRLSLVLFLFMLSTTYLGIAAVRCFAVWAGISGGMLCGAALLRYGLRGILLILAGIFPHYLVYLPAFFMLLSLCVQVCRQLCAEEGREGLGRLRRLPSGCLLRLCLAAAAVLLGCILESYVNPIFVTNILKIF